MHVCNLMLFFFGSAIAIHMPWVTKADTAHFAPGAGDILAEHSLGPLYFYPRKGSPRRDWRGERRHGAAGQLCSIDSNGYRKEGRLDAARLCRCRYALYPAGSLHWPCRSILSCPAVLCCLCIFFVLDIICIALHVSMRRETARPARMSTRW